VIVVLWCAKAVQSMAIIDFADVVAMHTTVYNPHRRSPKRRVQLLPLVVASDPELNLGETTEAALVD
jgi:hypothetical protein